MKVLAIIPARYQSTRFPGKPLVEIQGKSMIQRVYEQAMKANLVNQVVVATDDERIFKHIQELNYTVEMTRSDHQSGTDRCAEVAKKYTDYQIIVNVQGDEPFIAPKQIDAVIRPLLEQKAQISTLAKSISDLAILENPNVVKVVRNAMGNALYFSRSPIPFLRNLPRTAWLNQQLHFKHLGIYGFQRETLLKITQLPISILERAESLEQLRWLENGFSIAVELTDLESVGIDTPEDLEKIVRLQL
ncbi:MAG: 3-deoxy-manno-octulosonate cytidylyltransferase [Bacteroidota bacterium]